MSNQPDYYLTCMANARNAIINGDYNDGLMHATAAVSASPTFEAYLERILCLLELNMLKAAESDLVMCERLLGEVIDQPDLVARYQNLLDGFNATERLVAHLDNLTAKSVEIGDPFPLFPTYGLLTSTLETHLRILAKPSVSLKVRKGPPDRPDGSKFGGCVSTLAPDKQPRGPDGNGLPLLMQINLAELHNGFTGVPSHGILYFFFDPALCLSMSMGQSPEDRVSYKVVFDDAVGADLPTIAKPRWQANAIEAAYNTSLPSPISSDLFRLADSMHVETLEKYLALMHNYCGPFDHHLFGHPQLIVPEDLDFNAELLLNGVDLLSFYADSGPNLNIDQKLVGRCEENAANWMLLAQIDFDPIVNFFWGNKGRLFFWIRKTDLYSMCFDNVILQWQTHPLVISLFPESYDTTEKYLDARDRLWFKEVFAQFKSNFLR